MSSPTSPIDMEFSVDRSDTAANSNLNAQPSAANKDKSLTDTDADADTDTDTETDTVDAVAQNKEATKETEDDDAQSTTVETQNLNSEDPGSSTTESTKQKGPPLVREKAFDERSPETIVDLPWKLKKQIFAVKNERQGKI
ncbi:hypothetical protein C8R46DRAFT_1030135 [Mycena filopes]|nr:hypothetical protein C8R46DRAFT_1030135 [Mycena filopes]